MYARNGLIGTILLALLWGSYGNVNMRPSAPLTIERAFDLEPTQPFPIEALPSGLILVQTCNDQAVACRPAIWLDDYNGRYWQLAFTGYHLNIAHNRLLATFESERDIWLLDLQNGKSQNLTNTPDCEERDVSWSPDDTALAFLGCGGGKLADLFLFELSSGKRTNLSNTPERYEACFSTNAYPAADCWIGWWHAKSEILFAASGVPGSHRPGEVLSGRCHTYGGECSAFPTEILRDGKTYRVLDSVNGAEHLPALSPDGKTLAYDGGILYSMETGKQSTLRPSDYGLKIEAANAAGTPSLVAPSWSPDGTQMAWIGHINDRGDNGLYLFDLLHHTGQIVLTYSPYYVTLSLPPWQRWSNSSITWSPDSQWLTLSDTELDSQKSLVSAFLWVIHREGKIKVRFDKGSLDLGVPIWSPNSQKIIFVKNYFANAGIPQSLQMIEIRDWKVWQLSAPENTYPLRWDYK